MKKLTLLFAVFASIFFFTEIFSQGIPETINYQGVLKDASGGIVPDGNYNITFKLYDAESGGSVLWSETKIIAIADGILNTKLGSDTPIPTSTFSDAVWLGITIDTGSELIPRTALTSVPYSLMSSTVPDASITAEKIADNEVVKSLNGINDDVNLVAGSNVTITPSGSDITISATGGGGTIGGSGTAGYLPLFTNSTTIGNSSVSEESGRIGLDDNDPNYKLSLNTSGTAGLGLKIHRSGGTNLLIKNDNSPTDEKGWAFNVYNTNLQIRTIADNDVTTLQNVVTFQRDGYVGIGTDAPVTNMQVINDQYLPDGGFTLQQTSTSNRWQFYVSQSTDDLRLLYNDASMGAFDHTSGNYTPVSDSRLKKNIQPIGDMLGTVMKLEPKTYQLKNDNNPNSFSYGLIAQDVEKILPDIVTVFNGDDGDGITDLRMVSYTELIPVLIKALQEQQDMISKLTKRVEELEGR